MDTLSSSVSTLKIPSLPPTTTNREFHHFTRTPHATPTHRPPHPQPHVSSSTSIPNLVPKKIKTFSHNKYHSPSPSFSSSNTSPLKPIFHHKPTTGYAAAIIDVAQNSNSLHSVQRDVQRLLKFLQHVKFQSVGVDPSRVEEIKGEALRKVVVVEQGKFHGHVVALVKMLMRKKKVGIVEQVLEEFERIYDELCGTQVVLISSAKKMGEDEIFGIAKSVQQLSGGAARVKVRNLVQHSFPSFAV